MPEQCRGKFGGIFNRQALIHTTVIHGYRSPEGQRGRAGFAVDVDFAAGTSRRGKQSIVNSVVVSERSDADECAISCAGAGKNIHEDHVVVDGESRNGCAIGPDEIILAPPFTVALEGEVGVVGDNIAVNVFHAFLGQFIGKLFQNADSVGVTLSMSVVGQLAAG